MEICRNYPIMKDLKPYGSQDATTHLANVKRKPVDLNVDSNIKMSVLSHFSLDNF